MSARDLDAAGITDPGLRAAFAHCRRLNARHGRTFYLATWLLPPAKRPFVHALYGYARTADEAVDDAAVGDPAAALQAADGGPAALALRYTCERWGIEAVHREAFLTSMAADLTVGSYATYQDLYGYMRGSAVAIALQMLPVLEPVVPAVIAAPYAEDLGVAFQLTNFIRDVGEDLRRGRVYLPQEDLDLFGLTREDLASGVVDGRVRRLLAFEVARARELYRSAREGIRLLHPTSRPCIETAWVLYQGILDEVEREGYRVLDQRVAVPSRRRAAVALPALARSWAVRRG